MSEEKITRKTAGPPGPAVDDARRRMLRASAAAPLVVSLTPNPVAAMASVACDQKQTQLIQVQAAFSERADGTVKVQANEYGDFKGNRYYEVQGKAYAEDGSPLTTMPGDAARIGKKTALAKYSGTGQVAELKSVGEAAEDTDGLSHSCMMSLDR